MTTLERQIVDFFEDNLGYITNKRNVYIEMYSEFCFSATSPFPEAEGRVPSLALSGDWYSLSEFVEQLNLKTLQDIDKLDSNLLWDLYMKGKAEVLCNLSNDLVWFRLLSNNQTKNEESVMVKDDQHPWRICNAILRSPDDFIDFANRYHLGVIA